MAHLLPRFGHRCTICSPSFFAALICLAFSGCQKKTFFCCSTAQNPQEHLAFERTRLDAAAAREEQEDEEVLRARAVKQQQERSFIHDYLQQQECAKLERAMDVAAEEARQDLQSLPDLNFSTLRAYCLTEINFGCLLYVMPTIIVSCS